MVQLILVENNIIIWGYAEQLAASSGIKCYVSLNLATKFIDVNWISHYSSAAIAAS